MAIAAYKLKRPVRSVLDRDEDMQVSGYRHPCWIKYKAGFNNDGRINAAKFEIYSNAGNYLDISCSVRSTKLVVRLLVMKLFYILCKILTIIYFIVDVGKGNGSR